MKATRSHVYNRGVRRYLLAILLSLSACASADHGAYLKHELGFLQLGVQLASEEKEVRRVLAQRGLRVVARLEDPAFLALGAASRDGLKTAVRVISRRGVVIASDAALDDLFAPAKVALIEHFGGTLGDYRLVAEARVGRGRDVGCVTLHRLFPDGSSVVAELDVSVLGSRACVANLAPARSGRMAATIAWPGLHGLSTPQLEVELAFVETRLGEEPARIPVAHIAQQGEWLDRERTRLSTLRLSRAPFSERHAAGVARAAVALLAGQDTPTQVSVYRNAVASVYPASTESEVTAETAAHIERGWLDAEQVPEPEVLQAASEDGELEDAETIEPAAWPSGAEAESADDEALVIEPLSVEIRARALPSPARFTTTLDHGQ